MEFPKKTLGAAAGLGVAGAVGHSYYPQEFGNVMANVGSGVDTVIGGAGELANKGAEYVLEPIIGGAAPYAAPMVAGAYGMNKLADLLKIESKWLRTAMTVGGGAAGAGLATTAASPYLVGGAAAVFLAKPILNTGLHYSKKALSGLYGATIGAPVGAVKGSVKGLLNGGKNGYLTPSLKPQVGF